MANSGAPGLVLSVLQRRLLLVLVLGLIAAATAGGFQVGRSLTELDRQYLQSLEIIRTAYEERLNDTQRALTDSRLAYDVERQTLTTLRADLALSHQQSVALNEEVTFYRSLMAPDKVAKGLQIAEFEVTPGADGTLVYHLLLTQVASRRTWVAGKVEILIAGETDSAEGTAVLPLTDLADLQQYPVPYRFRYFQDLTGSLRLPGNFEPTEVRVTVIPKRGKKIERSFAWQAG
ncbi:MAG: DUF6776 family protein [Pseudomonadota bacterium]